MTFKEFAKMLNDMAENSPELAERDMNTIHIAKDTEGEYLIF